MNQDLTENNARKYFFGELSDAELTAFEDKFFAEAEFSDWLEEIETDLIDDYVLTTEEEILAGMRLVLKHHHYVIEGSAGVAVAAILQQKDKFKGKKVAAIICGGNVSEVVLKKVVCI